VLRRKIVTKVLNFKCIYILFTLSLFIDDVSSYVKIDLRKIGWDGVDWIDLAQNAVVNLRVL
jgi:hypothetical protein